MIKAGAKKSKNERSKRVSLSPKGQDTRKRILLRAAELFAKWGHNGVGLIEIAEAIGGTKGSLYYHFNGKRHIYTECVSLVISTAFDKTKHPQWDENPEIRLRQYLEWLLSVLKKSSLARRLLLHMIIDHDLKLFSELTTKGPMGYSQEIFIGILKDIKLKQDKAVLTYFVYSICMLNDELVGFADVWIPGIKNKVGGTNSASFIEKMIKSW
jgi:AcrR family transcriptional regulator